MPARILALNCSYLLDTVGKVKKSKEERKKTLLYSYNDKCAFYLPFMKGKIVRIRDLKMTAKEKMLMFNSDRPC